MPYKTLRSTPPRPPPRGCTLRNRTETHLRDFIHAPPCSWYSLFYCFCYQMKCLCYGLCCVIHPQVLTKDSVTVAVDAVVYFRIYNATMSITNVENANRSTRLLAQTTLRNVLGTKNLSDILGERETISETMQVNKLSLYLQISIP